MTVTKDTTILDLTNTYPDTIPFIANSGLLKIADPNIRTAFGQSVSLEDAAKACGIPVDEFLGKIKNVINLGETSGRSEVRIQGLLPCPVRMPMLEVLDGAISHFTRETGAPVDCDLQAAFVGTDWISEDIESAEAAEDLPDIFLSAGFRLFLTDPRMIKLRNDGWFADRTGWDGMNSFATRNSLADPDRRYGIIGVVPAVFMVNTALLGDRPMPKSWADVLKPEFVNSLALPVSEFDLFDSLLLGIHQQYGKEALVNLGRNMYQQMHPSQMIAGADSSPKVDGPTVTIMPYFFTKTVPEQSPLVPVWPEDGALTAPILLITRSDRPELQSIIDAISGNEMSDVLSKRGFFPSTHPDNPDFDGEEFPLQWPGWEYLLSIDLSAHLDECTRIFNHGATQPDATMAGLTGTA